MSLQIRRGTAAQNTIVPDNGEPLWITDSQELRIGDGATTGGLIPKCRTTGSAGGDLSGTYPDPTVIKLRGVTIQSGTPANNQMLVYTTATGQWNLGNATIVAKTVDPSAPSDGDTLVYDNANSQWIHVPGRIGTVTVSPTAPTADQTLVYSSTNSRWEPTSARLGTKTYAVFTPQNNNPPATGFATLDTRGGTAVLDFDEATDEAAVFVGIMPEAAVLTSGVKIRIHWTASTATSGSCIWGAQIERMNTDLDQESYDTIAYATGTANATSGIITTTEITLTAIDSVAAGEPFRLKIIRDADASSGGTDNMTGDAELWVVEVRGAV